MNKIFLIILLFNSAFARAEDWKLISTDNLSNTFLSNEKIIDLDNKKRFKVKSIFKNSRDIMGLQYNSTITSFIISCELDLINARQQFAFNGNELVWTFPESTKDERASAEIPKKALEEVCIK